MKIDTGNPNLMAALNARLTKELGETFAANCALDIIGDSLAVEIADLKAHNAALIERTTADRDLIATLRAEIARLSPAAKRKGK